MRLMTAFWPAGIVEAVDNVSEFLQGPDAQGPAFHFLLTADRTSRNEGEQQECNLCCLVHRHTP